MKYLMLICADESVELSPEEVADVQAATEAWAHPAARFGAIEVRPFWQQ